jgi:hypothetical protein
MQVYIVSNPQVPHLQNVVFLQKKHYKASTCINVSQSSPVDLIQKKGTNAWGDVCMHTLQDLS